MFLQQQLSQVTTVQTIYSYLPLACSSSHKIEEIIHIHHDPETARPRLVWKTMFLPVPLSVPCRLEKATAILVDGGPRRVQAASAFGVELA